MKKTDKSINYKHSFLYHFFVRFILMIIVPILFLWWLYVEVLNYYYYENTLATQQINMENSVSWLDSSLNAASNVFTALGSNTEITYYMEYYTDKPTMLYSLLKNVRSFCSSLYMMTPYLTSLKIYSDNPTLLYANPFVKYEDIPLDADVLDLLEKASPKEIIWQMKFLEGDKFPIIYGYQKLYIANYVKCIGYMEMQLSSDLFADYFDLLSDLGGDPYAEFFLYQGDTMICSYSLEENKPTDPPGWDSMESGCEIHLLKNQYINAIRIPQLDLCVVRSGKITNLLAGFSNNLPSILISIIIFLLLALFIWFFLQVASFSKRILVFSSFIKNSDTDNLTPFHPDLDSKKDTDEWRLLAFRYIWYDRII